VSSFKKVFVSAVNDWSGDRMESKEVSNWIGIGSSVSEVMGILEYVFVGIRNEGLLQRIQNSRSVLHDVELNGGVRPMYKDLELSPCPDMLFQPI
jgi:hypothetical protein